MNNYFTKEPIRIDEKNGSQIFVFADGSNYSDAFGYEWTEYSRTYTDSTIGSNLSLRRLELNLGFPVEFLKGLTVLELGSGQGRFTEHLAKYAKQVITGDMSDAIYHNVALGTPNVIAVRADINHFPDLVEKVDVVFCRGVLQHTEDPVKSMQALFNNVKDGGLVIFDVYKKTGGFRLNFKYFWRPVVQLLFTEKGFDTFMKKHESALYTLHHGILSFLKLLGPLGKLLNRLPVSPYMDYETQYPQVDLKKRKEIFRNEYIDMFFAAYDKPMSPEEVIDALAKIGQTPFSYDPYRNHFRVKKSSDMRPINVKITKNGVVPVTYYA